MLEEKQMMYKGFKPEVSSGAYEQLPVGGYVLRIMKVSEGVNEWLHREVLRIEFDIAEGDYSGFFAKQWRNDTRDNKKWSGTHELFIPIEGTSRYYDSEVRAMNNFFGVCEASNPNFHVNPTAIQHGDYGAFKGFLIGGIFREEEYRKKDSGGIGSNINLYRIVTPETIRTDDYTIPEKKAVKAESNTYSGNYTGYNSNAYSGNYGGYNNGDAVYTGTANRGQNNNYNDVDITVEDEDLPF